MHKSEQIDSIVEKWKQCTAREKAETIGVFLNECGRTHYLGRLGYFLAYSASGKWG